MVHDLAAPVAQFLGAVDKGYTADVAYDVAQTTVSATTCDDGTVNLAVARTPSLSR